MDDKFIKAVRKVVKNGNCTGCGACTLVSSRVSIELAEDGFLRPVVSSDTEGSGRMVDETARFNAVCPGIRLDAPVGREQNHPVFGAYTSAWQGWAADAGTRYQGSSGGVLTALSAWLLKNGRSDIVTASTGGTSDPLRTIAKHFTDSAEIPNTAGSRYAPVANLTAFDPQNPKAVLVGKPCEVSAVARLNRTLELSDDDRPLRLSFFCAGTPSQLGTGDLVSFLGMPVSSVSDVRYRGNGWPGRFVAVGDGKSVSMSYDESWGKHIGRNIQWRCKICVDGTGGDADISVGDFWSAGDNGFPNFDDADGNSVVIARTPRGHELLMEAVEDGVLVLTSVDLDDVAEIQPLQVDRKYLLIGRLLGRLFSGNRIPQYRGYRLGQLVLRNPKGNLRAIVGTARRSMNPRNGSAR